MVTLSPNISRCVSSQSSLKRSAVSSPSSRRALCILSSKRFIEICRKTVAKVSSIFSVSIDSLTSWSSSAAIKSWKTSISANVEAISAVVSGV